MSDSVVSLGQPETEGGRKTRKNNPEKTREDILQAAINEFVQQGLAGELAEGFLPYGAGGGFGNRGAD